jgi:hypothetical protein
MIPHHFASSKRPAHQRFEVMHSGDRVSVFPTVEEASAFVAKLKEKRLTGRIFDTWNDNEVIPND